MDEQVTAPQQTAVIDTGYHLVVVHPFGPHVKGTKIEDQAVVADVLAGENAHFVRKVFPQ